MKTPLVMRVRPAAKADLDALVALEQASFTHDRLSRRQYRHHLASRSASIWLAETDDGQLLGAAVALWRRGSTVGRLYSLATALAARGQGVGARLITELEQNALARGCDRLRLEVRMDNAAARHLYQRAGFAPLARLAGYYADGMDAWRLQKRLAPSAPDV